jgi:hypothetical protein
MSAEPLAEVFHADLVYQLVDPVDLAILLLPRLEPQRAQVVAHLSVLQLPLREAGQLLLLGLQLFPQLGEWFALPAVFKRLQLDC